MDRYKNYLEDYCKVNMVNAPAIPSDEVVEWLDEADAEIERQAQEITDLKAEMEREMSDALHDFKKIVSMCDYLRERNDELVEERVAFFEASASDFQRQKEHIAQLTAEVDRLREAL